MFALFTGNGCGRVDSNHRLQPYEGCEMTTSLLRIMVIVDRRCRNISKYNVFTLIDLMDLNYTPTGRGGIRTTSQKRLLLCIFIPRMVEAVGFEPTNAGAKGRCVTTSPYLNVIAKDLATLANSKFSPLLYVAIAVPSKSKLSGTNFRFLSIRACYSKYLRFLYCNSFVQFPRLAGLLL